MVNHEDDKYYNDKKVLDLKQLGTVNYNETD